MIGQASRRVGRPLVCSPALLQRIVGMYDDEGLSYRKIATLLNAEGILTPCGAELWWHTHVYRLLGTVAAYEVRKEREIDHCATTLLAASEPPMTQMVRRPCREYANRTLRYRSTRARPITANHDRARYQCQHQVPLVRAIHQPADRDP